jgi:hypothetical protein
MATNPEASPFARAALIVVAVLALYVAAFFPAMSVAARSSRYAGVLAPWNPLPFTMKNALFRAWSAIDPAGAAQLAFRP